MAKVLGVVGVGFGVGDAIVPFLCGVRWGRINRTSTALHCRSEPLLLDKWHWLGNLR